MSKKLVKDLKENDICFFVYDDGVANIVNCDSIKKSNIGLDFEYYEVTFISRNNGAILEYSCKGECDFIMGDDHVIYLNKVDALEQIEYVIKECNVSKELINEY